MFRLAYIVTHPIQYQAPLLRQLAARPEIDLKVLFLSDFSLHPHRETLFNQMVRWDVPMTEGYAWEVVPRLLIGKSTPLRPHWPVAGLEQRLRAGRFDAVWVHGWGHVGLRQAIRAAARLRLPLLLRGETTPDGSRATGLRRWLRDRYCRRVITQAAGCLCIGSRNREFYRQFGAPDEKLFTVPYAVDNQWFRARCLEASAQRVSLRAKLKLQPGRPVILFAAKFISVKAPNDLLRAYQNLWGAGKGEAAGKPYLLFVGDGPLRATLEQEAGALKGKDVHFLGFKNQTELPVLYDLCDVFVLPSHFEPWGLVVNEVMNAGKAVIVSSRVGAAPDLVIQGENGWVFPAKEATALADCLASAFDGRDLNVMGQRSLKIIDHWDFAADTQGLLAALEATATQWDSRRGTGPKV